MKKSFGFNRNKESCVCDDGEPDSERRLVHCYYGNTKKMQKEM